jgi:ketosteroid isomerase-like protein
MSLGSLASGGKGAESKDTAPSFFASPRDQSRRAERSTLTDPTEKRRGPVPARDRLKLVCDCYGAYESGDRRVVEERLTDDFTFYSPADVGIDRAAYFERCWPNSELIEAFEFKRIVEAGDEVVVTYESKKTDGRRFRNTEVLTFKGDKICRQKVYFGWDLE